MQAFLRLASFFSGPVVLMRSCLVSVHCWLSWAVSLPARKVCFGIFWGAVVKKLSVLSLVEKAASSSACMPVFWCRKLLSVLRLAEYGDLWKMDIDFD